MKTIQMTKLKNGLRVVTDYVPGMHSVAVGIWAKAGARDEDMTYNGVAHMVEHMLFKGTKTRNALEIVQQVESVGGHMNAYTSREITSYHIHLISEHLPLALDILTDMYQNSTLPGDEIERERDVILQEIGMCQDTPDELVFDNYYETAYADQPLGAPILGRPEIIQAMPEAALRKHIETFYTPDRTVVSAAGDVDHESFVTQVEKALSNLPVNCKTVQKPGKYTGGDVRAQRDLEQAHIVFGFEGVSRLNDAYYAAMAFSNILGGGMSSRLFQEIREKRGLVYSIFSFCSVYQESGQFGIYAGTGPDSLPALVPVVCNEILRFVDTVNEQELDRAKAQLKSSTLMARESMMTRADQQAKYLMFREKCLDPVELVQKIDALEIADIQNVARKILKSPLTLSALGPLEKLENYEIITKRLAA